MAKLTDKQYLELAEKVGVEEMKTIEEASGVSTGLLDSTKQSSRPKVKAKNSKDNPFPSASNQVFSARPILKMFDFSLRNDIRQPYLDRLLCIWTPPI